MVGFGVWLFSTIDWDRILTLANEQAQDLPKPLERQLEQAILYAIYFLPPAILLLLAGLGRAGHYYAGLPVLLYRPATMVRLPYHRLLHLDDPVPALPGCAGRGPLQADGTSGR